MKKSLLALISVFTLSYSYSQVSIMWVSRYTSTGANIDRATDMVLDAAGNVYVTGTARGSVSANFDIVTVKYDNNGNQLWVAEYNGPGNGLDDGRAIAIDNVTGNVYMTGWSYGGATTVYDYVTVMYNSAGVQQWATRYNFGNGNDDPSDITVDASGNAYVTGGSDANATGTGTGTDYATVKYNNAGVQQWATRYSNLASANLDIAYALTLDATGNVFVTGLSSGTGTNFDYATIKYNTAGAQQWVSRYNNAAVNGDEEAHSIAVDNATGNVYATGWSRGPGIAVPNFDYATVMINSAGAQQWATRYDSGDLDNDRANDLTIDAAGNAYVTGKSKMAATAEDATTIKYNNAGAQQWVTRYNQGGANYDEGKSIMLNAAGDIYITGYTYSGATNNDYVTIKYNNAGVQQWLTKYNGPGNNTDQAVAVWVDAVDNVYVTGASRGSGTQEDYGTIKYCQMTTVATPDTGMCMGQTIQLSATSAGATAYSWSPATGLSSTTISNPNCNATVTTTYVVVVTNANGCTDADSVTVTVNPLPSPTITASGPTSFCIGGSVTLSSSGYAAYQWNPTASTNDSITVSTAGNYTLTVTDTNGCQATAMQNVTVNPLPTVNAGPDTAVCTGFSTTLNATGATTWSWTPVGTLSNPSIANPVAAPLTTTTYTVVGTDGNGCSNSDSVTVTIYPNPPAPSITYVPFGQIQSSAATTYQWYFCSGPTLIPGATSQTYVPAVNDTFCVEVCDTNGCCSFSSPYVVTFIGIEEIDFSSQVSVFPNPSNGLFTIGTTLNLKNAEMKIYNAIGEEIGNWQFAGNKMQIDLSDKPKGIYLLQIRSEEKVMRKKVIIQ